MTTYVGTICSRIFARLLNGTLYAEFLHIFVGGYLVIWAVIYSIIKKNTDRINEVLKKQKSAEDQR